MAVSPPLTDDFVINGGFAAMTFFSIILTIYLIRYRFRICREERRTWVQAHPCRLRGTGCQSPCAPSRVLAALGQLCLVIMLAAAGVMCGTRGSALAQEGTAWSDSVTLPYDAGTYYLTTDVTIGGGGIWTVPSGGVTLDLNGHNVTGCQFRIDSGVTLTVKDMKNSGEITFETWPIAVNGGSFYFEGGTLTTSGDNWIVEVKDNGNDNGNFYMSGGTITGGNRGVYLQNQSHFAMTGGEIINSSSYGVVIRGDSTAAISGGKISGHGYDGIRAVSGEVTMSGGVIKGNQNGIVIGDRDYSGTLNLSGGTITGNTLYGINYRNGELNLSDAGAPHPTVTGNGSNVYIEDDVSDLRINVTEPLSPSAMLGISMAKPGVFTNGLNNPGTSANFSSDDSSYDVCLTAAGEATLGKAVASITSDGVTNRYTKLQDAMDAAQPNDKILLLDDINASTDKFPILVWREDITLDLNGKTISGSPDSSSGDLIQIDRKKVGGDYSYGQLTLNDGSAEKSGEIICDPGGCENVINIMGGEPNVLTMYGGKISGGATNVRVDGNFTMHGGEISGGTTNVKNTGKFVMNGGKISGGTIGVFCHTSCSMVGGEISGASGNGVTLDGTTGVFYLSGGEIKGNGQYAIEAFEKSFVYISNENPIIVSRGSTESSRGIYLNEGSGISIYNTPAAGSSIGVTLKSGAGVAARGRSNAPTEDDLEVFCSDEGYDKFLNTAEKAIVFGYQISYDAGGAEGDLPEPLNLDPTDTTADPKVPDRGSLTKTGYRFTGWKDESDNEYAAGANFKTLIATYKPSGSVKLTAQWTVNNHKVSYEVTGTIPAGAPSAPAETTADFGTDVTVEAGLTLEGYTFSGWTTDDAAVSDGKFTVPDGDVKFTGSWTINTYAVTWKNWDGTVLETDKDVPYGTTPSYDGVTPVRPADEEYTYTFTGWTPKIVEVTADAVYTAAYSNKTILYTVKVIPGANMTKTADSGAEEQTVNKGSAIKAVVYTAAPGYYFPEDYSVNAVHDISVSRDSDKQQITVSGLPTDDTEIKLKDPEKGSEVEAPVIDLKEGTYSEPQRVTISCATEGAVIYYTTDGSEPSVNSTKYEGPFTIDKTTTIKSVAVLNGKYISIVVAEILTIEIPPESWKINVDIHNFSNTGAKGVPGDVPRTEFDLTVQIVDKESGEIVSTGADVKVAVMGGPNTAKISLKDVEFNRKVEDLSEAKYKVVVKGFPKKVTGVAPMSQVYSLSYSAWPGGRNLITIYLKWDDGKRSEPERIKVYALPEDEIGAYTIDKNGVKEYLIFHTYDICMQWLGSDDLCSGHERCFHKENPYVNPFVKDGGLIGEIVN